MIPLKDTEASHRLTVVNTALVVANIAVFVLELRIGTARSSFFLEFGMVPARITSASATVFMWGILTLVTSLFVHAGLLHIGGNMLYLFIFGPAVEERMGHLRYLCFYISSGVIAGLAMVAMGPASRVAVVGASGAIAGVLGAYFVTFPRGLIRTFLFKFIDVPAVFYLLLWFAVQLVAGIESGASGPQVGGVAFWAHVGGFLFGIAAAPLLVHRQAPKIIKRRRKS